MAETIGMNTIYHELLALRKEVHFIKAHMADADMFLTSEEEEKLEKALKEHKEGKTISLQELKKELSD